MKLYKDAEGNTLPEGQKHCPDCDRVYELENFYTYKKNGGRIYYLRRCKRCHNSRGRAWWKETGYGEKYYKENKQELAKKKKEAMKSQEARDKQSIRYKRYWDNPKNDVKNKARAVISTGVAKGDIVKPEACEFCGSLNEPLEAHHYDYTKPLYVSWICKTCHGAWHKSNKTVQDEENTPQIE